MVALQQAYEQIKDERRQLDFEDVLLATAGMLDSEPRVAEQVRAQYRFFVVDEYQDVSPLQQELLDLWLGDAHRPLRRRRRQPDHLLVRGGDPATTCWASRRGTRMRRSCGSRRNYRSSARGAAPSRTG